MADDLISIDLLQRQLAEKDAEIGRVKAKAKRFVVEKLRDVQSSLVQQERRQQQFATLLELAMGPEQDLEAHQDQSEIKIEEVLGPSELKLVYSFREVLAVAATNEKKHAEQIAQVSADRSQLMTQLDTIKAKAKEKLNAMASESASLREQLVDAEQARMQQQKECATATQETEALRSELAATSAAMEELQLQLETEQLRSSKAIEAEEANAAAVAELQASQRDAATSAGAAEAAAKNSQTRLEEEAARMVEQLRSLTQTNHSLQSQLDKIGDTHASVVIELEEKSAESAGLRAKVRSLQHELRRTKPSSSVTGPGPVLDTQQSEAKQLTSAGASDLAESERAAAAQQAAVVVAKPAMQPIVGAAGQGISTDRVSPAAQLETLRTALAESERKNELQAAQAKVLKAEIRELDRHKARTLEAGTNSEYLKNIFVTFMETDNFDELFPVLNTILQFSPAEKRRMQKARKARSTSYLGSAAAYLPSSGKSLLGWASGSNSTSPSKKSSTSTNS